MSNTVALYGFGGSGGGGLNFKVVSGTAQPSNPAENTIWVNTSTEITGWYFQAEQPASMKNGEVWISTGTESAIAFNALKKNTLEVYPLSAKQYISGALVYKTSMIYQGGEWAEWIIYLYNKGNECESFGGIWTSSGYARSGFTISAPTKESNRFIITGNGATTNGICGKQNAVNLDKVNEIRANVTGLGTTNGGGFLIVSESKVIPKDLTTLPAYVRFDSNSTAGNQSVKVPVDTLNGNYYVCFICGTQDAAGFSVEEVWFV